MNAYERKTFNPTRVRSVMVQIERMQASFIRLSSKRLSEIGQKRYPECLARTKSKAAKMRLGVMQDFLNHELFLRSRTGK